MWIDQDAAGFGWLVDSTPDTDEEFGLNSHESSYNSAAAGRMDLLTVLAHELGHLLGFEHDPARPPDVRNTRPRNPSAANRYGG